MMVPPIKNILDWQGKIQFQGIRDEKPWKKVSGEIVIDLVSETGIEWEDNLSIRLSHFLLQSFFQWLFPFHFSIHFLSIIQFTFCLLQPPKNITKNGWEWEERERGRVHQESTLCYVHVIPVPRSWIPSLTTCVATVTVTECIVTLVLFRSILSRGTRIHGLLLMEFFPLHCVLWTVFWKSSRVKYGNNNENYFLGPKGTKTDRGNGSRV